MGHGLALRLQFCCKHKFRGPQPRTRPTDFPWTELRNCAARQTFSFLQLYTLYINALGANQNSPFNWNIFCLPERLLQADESPGRNLESQPSRCWSQESTKFNEVPRLVPLRMQLGVGIRLIMDTSLPQMQFSPPSCAKTKRKKKEKYDFVQSSEGSPETGPRASSP